MSDEQKNKTEIKSLKQVRNKVWNFHQIAKAYLLNRATKAEHDKEYHKVLNGLNSLYQQTMKDKLFGACTPLKEFMADFKRNWKQDREHAWNVLDSQTQTFCFEIDDALSDFRKNYTSVL